MKETLRAISEDISLDIAFYYEDVGMMNRIKTSYGSDWIRQMADYFIRYDMTMIEQIGGQKDEIERRLAKLRRPGSDRPGDGDGNQVSERTGIFNQPTIWDPYP